MPTFVTLSWNETRNETGAEFGALLLGYVILKRKWSDRRGSNSRPPHPQSGGTP
jgi:hypothetical protein